MTELTDVPKRCETCSRPLVTARRLSEAIHSGCALTGEKHDLDKCPAQANFLLDGKGIHDYITRHSDVAD